MRPNTSRIKLAITAVAALSVGAATAQDVQSLNTYGVPGLVEMPTAFAQPDGELSANLAFFGGTGRLGLAFQLAPRLQGVFRYATIPDYGGPGTERNYDRSFDLRWQVLREGVRRPAVTVGLQDFGGTGIYAGEYVVASKRFAEGRLAVTGGIGWGRLGSRDGFRNPLGVLGDRFLDRPRGTVGEGGEFSAAQWFRGPAALFGGVAWQATDRLELKAEYSSDRYDLETARGINEDRSPINLGLSYEVRPGLHLAGYSVLGSEIGLGLSFALNPKRPPNGASGIGTAPRPVLARPPRAAQPALWSEGWAEAETLDAARPALEKALRETLTEAGLDLESYRLDAQSVVVRFRNPTYREETQAVGRAARALTYALPPSVERFTLVPVSVAGLAGAAVTLRRSDLEALEAEPDRVWQSYLRAEIRDAAEIPTDGLRAPEGRFPALSWQLGPYVASSFFDPDNPLRVDAGLSLGGRIEPVPGLVFSGQLRQRVIGNRDEADRPSDSVLPRVRSESFLYAREDGPTIPELTAAWFFRPAPELYGRVTAGLLESQFGGVSAELLWRPQESRVAFGAEINRVRQRGFAQRLTFRDYEVTTGHVSAYLDHGGEFRSQLDLGRYLAGDVGATYTLTREFENGWRVSAYATKTDVSSEEFGEGSFDKGISIRIPFDWVLGRPTRSGTGLLIQPILRDGGARLRVANRLYGLTRGETEPDLGDDWSRFWR